MNINDCNSITLYPCQFFNPTNEKIKFYPHTIRVHTVYLRSNNKELGQFIKNKSNHVDTTEIAE